MAFITQQSSSLFSLKSNNGVGVSSSNSNFIPQTNFIRIRPFINPRISASVSDSNGEEPATTDPVKLAFARARMYKKSKQLDMSPKQEQTQNPFPDSGKVGTGTDVSVSENNSDGAKEEIPISVRIALEKAKEYKKNKGGAVRSSTTVGEKEKGLEKVNLGNSGYGGISEEIVSKKEKLTVPSIDFKGLEFSDKKKSRGLPAGLAPLVDSFPDGDIPEVEFLVGDTSKFGRAKQLEPESTSEDDSDVYKPKVSTWGVFPRPSNISKTFGGGKVIRPGEIIETAEDKAAKEARTRKLLEAYKSKTGINIDPKLKAECEKALKDGDQLMDNGRLKEALPYYEKIMKELNFQTELHGLAALQWSICQDSLTRQSEAKGMYEKLQSHPNAQVRKKASQFLFAFEAMVMMKVTSSSPSSTTAGYRNYFEAFVEDKTSYPLRVGKGEAEEGEEGPECD